MTSSSLRVPVHELLRAPGTSRRLKTSAVLEGLATPTGGVAEGTAVTIEGRLDGLSDGVWLDGVIGGTYRLECTRCLAPVEVPFSHAVGELFSSSIRPSDEDGYPLRGEEIDVEPLLRDTLLLGIPARQYCRSDCAGLCPRCGADLNEGPCACPPESEPPLLAALTELFSPPEGAS